MGEQQLPTVREETAADQIHNGLLGVNDVVYVEGEMVREGVVREPLHTEVMPGAEVVAGGEMGKIPGHGHSTQEDIVTHHAEDVAMHDREVAEQNPIIIVES